jgi:hypothetical protein
MIDYRGTVVCFLSWHTVCSAITRNPKTRCETVYSQPIMLHDLKVKVLSAVGWLESLSMKLC